MKTLFMLSTKSFIPDVFFPTNIKNTTIPIIINRAIPVITLYMRSSPLIILPIKLPIRESIAVFLL